MKLSTTSKFMSSDISFEKKNKKNLTTKMKVCTSSEFMNNDTSFEKKIYHYTNETLHNW